VATPLHIPFPLPQAGGINTRLLRGKAPTLVDTGPRDDEALSALEAGRVEEPVTDDCSAYGAASFALGSTTTTHTR